MHVQQRFGQYCGELAGCQVMMIGAFVGRNACEVFLVVSVVSKKELCEEMGWNTQTTIIMRHCSIVSSPNESLHSVHQLFKDIRNGIDDRARCKHNVSDNPEIQSAWGFGTTLMPFFFDSTKFLQSPSKFRGRNEELTECHIDWWQRTLQPLNEPCDLWQASFEEMACKLENFDCLEALPGIYSQPHGKQDIVDYHATCSDSGVRDSQNHARSSEIRLPELNRVRRMNKSRRFDTFSLWSHWFGATLLEHLSI